MSNYFDTLLTEIDRDMVDMAKKMFDVDGNWYYRDLSKMTFEYFDKLVTVIGEENIRWITLAEYSERDGSRTRRGQMIYSEQGRLNTGKWLRGEI